MNTTTVLTGVICFMLGAGMAVNSKPIPKEPCKKWINAVEVTQEYWGGYYNIKYEDGSVFSTASPQDHTPSRCVG